MSQPFAGLFIESNTSMIRNAYCKMRDDAKCQQHKMLRHGLSSCIEPFIRTAHARTTLNRDSPLPPSLPPPLHLFLLVTLPLSTNEVHDIDGVHVLTEATTGTEETGAVFRPLCAVAPAGFAVLRAYRLAWRILSPYFQNKNGYNTKTQRPKHTQKSQHEFNSTAACLKARNMGGKVGGNDGER